MTEQLLRKGDLVVILSIDRLGRNYSEIHEQWKLITEKIGADIKVLDMPLLDTSSNVNNLDARFIADLVLQILSYVAEKERENTRKRQRQGIDVMPVKDGKRYSTKTGRPVGRPPVEYPDHWKEIYTAWKEKKITAVQAMNRLDLKKNSFYTLVKRYDSDKIK
jgi:DNA invertase Pin-like site-specific DNA recombinase